MRAKCQEEVLGLFAPLPYQLWLKSKERPPYFFTKFSHLAWFLAEGFNRLLSAYAALIKIKFTKVQQITCLIISRNYQKFDSAFISS